MPDYSFMRAGRGGLLDPAQPADPAFMGQATAVLSIFVENALHDAATYASHAGRSRPARRDLLLALRAQALPSGGFWAQPDLAASQQRSPRSFLFRAFMRSCFSSTHLQWTFCCSVATSLVSSARKRRAGA